MAAVFAALEGAFALADAGIGPWPDLRWQAYRYLAFFDIYFERVRDGHSVPPEFWTSLLTHAFLHGGMLHLVMNGAIFLALGGHLARGLGSTRFLILFTVTAGAGALTLALITDTRAPLVGASGALFGFIGALKFWEWRYIRLTGAPANRFWGTIIGLTVMNVALWLYFPGEGSLAWEAHLGGFAAGFLIAPVLAPRAAGPSPI